MAAAVLIMTSGETREAASAGDGDGGCRAGGEPSLPWRHGAVVKQARRGSATTASRVSGGGRMLLVHVWLMQRVLPLLLVLLAADGIQQMAFAETTHYYVTIANLTDSTSGQCSNSSSSMNSSAVDAGEKCNLRAGVQFCMDLPAPAAPEDEASVCRLELVAGTHAVRLGEMEMQFAPAVVEIVAQERGVATAVVVDGSDNGGERWLYVENSNGRLSLEGITVRGFTDTTDGSSGGGALYVSNSDSVSVANVSFVSNSAAAAGGALYVQRSASVSYSNVTWRNNTAMGGGGGAVYHDNGDDVTFSDCVFVANTAAGSGGATYVWRSDSGAFTACRWIANRAGEHGGAHYIQDCEYTTLLRGLWRENEAGVRGGAVYAREAHHTSFLDGMWEKNEATGGHGGAVFLHQSDNNEFDAGTWLQNNASTSGGGLATEQSGATTLTNCSFRNNTADTDDGGGLHLARSGGASFTNCTWSLNAAGDDGGAGYLSSSASATFVNCSWQENTAQDDGGALTVVSSSDSGTLVNCTWAQNVAKEDGGAMFVANSDGTRLSRGTVSENAATRGGAMYVDTVGLSIFDMSFANNYAEDGGASFFQGSHNVFQATGCSWTKNEAGESGGGFFVAGRVSGLAFANCSWRGNEAPVGGAGYIAARAHKFNFSSSSFTHNTAELGGALYVQSDVSDVLFEDTTWHANEASSSGGAVDVVERSELTFRGASWTANVALSGGGALYAGARNRLAMHACTAEGNEATTGGAILLLQDNEINISASNLTKNVASGTGAAIASLQRTAHARITNCTFKSNVAGVAGGALAAGSSDNWTIHASVFDGNTASLGGALRAQRWGRLVVRNSSYHGNTGKVAGGAIALYGAPSSVLRLEHCLLSSNEATTSDGGGIFVSGATLRTYNTTFVSNRVGSSGGSGGAIAGTSGARINISMGTLLIANSASSGGGVRAEDGTELALWHTDLWSNNATSGGGAVALSSASVLTMRGTTMQSNTAATGSGGGLQLAASASALLLDSIVNGNMARWGGGVATASANLTVAENSPIMANFASSGGGGMFWTAGAPYPPASNFSFTNNTAQYGPNLATPMIALSAPDRRTADSGDAIPEVSVRVVDAYNQTVVTADGSVVVNADFVVPATGDLPAVEGSTVEIVHNGTARFSDTAVTYDPGSVVTAEFTSASGTLLSTECTISLRLCQTGEIISGDVCQICGAGEYTWSSNATSCNDCLRHATCPADNGTVIILNKGYWRETNYSTKVRSCPASGSCEGGADPDNQCSSGSSGPLCLVCDDGYYQQSALDKCASCESGQRYAPLIIAASIIVAGVVAFFLLQRSKFAWSEAVTTVATTQVYWRILFVYVQIISQFPFLFSAVAYPDKYAALLNAFSLTNIAISAAFSPQCWSSSYNFFDTLLVQTLSGFGLLTAILLGFGAWSLWTKHPDKRSELWSQAFAWCLLLTYVVFPGTSTTVFQTFSCDHNFEDTEDGEKQVYLKADYSISCRDSEYKDYRAYAIAMVLVYPIGITALYASVLWRYRRHICPGVEAIAKDLENTETPLAHIASLEMQELSNGIRELERLLQTSHRMAPYVEYTASHLHSDLQCVVRNKDPALLSVQMLYDPYKPAMWYMEVVECIRRLLTSSVLVFMWPGTSGQVAIALVINAAFLVLYSRLMPYRGHANALVISVFWSVLIQLFATLLIIEGIISNDTAVGDALVAIVFLGPLVPAFFYCYWWGHEHHMGDRSRTAMHELSASVAAATEQLRGRHTVVDENPILHEMYEL